MRTLKLMAVTLALAGLVAAGCQQSEPSRTGSPTGGTTSAPGGSTAAPASSPGQAPAQPGESPK